jgi:hypothetical protein
LKGNELGREREKIEIKTTLKAKRIKLSIDMQRYLIRLYGA